MALNGNGTPQLQGFRPCQWLVGYEWGSSESCEPLWLTASVCYDATDLQLASQLRDVSDVFAIPALNRDITTFDQMALSLHYHMFQLIVVANTGSYGGSNAYAPYRDQFVRQWFHLHGQPQAPMAFIEIDDIGASKARKADANASSTHSGGKQENDVGPSVGSKWKFPPAGM